MFCDYHVMINIVPISDDLAQTQDVSIKPNFHYFEVLMDKTKDEVSFVIGLSPV